jgi:cobalamin biosynthesis Mg chelatase CobN
MVKIRPFRLVRAVLAAIVVACLVPSPAAPLDLFARHNVTVQFATSDGKPMADTEVRVFAPGQPNRPAFTGRTDSEGKFEFGADQDGLWSAEARNGSEVARASVRVGGQEQQKEPLSPLWVIGGLVVLLVVAFLYRLMWIRRRRTKP